MISGLESYDLLVLQLPVWFPGAIFKRASIECLKAGHDVKEIPFHYVKEVIVSHTTRSIETTDRLVTTNSLMDRCHHALSLTL
jgi:hypothetical protein